MDKLGKMLTEQAELSERIKEEHDLKHSTGEWINLLCNTISNETEELRDETPWKYWSKDETFDKEKAKEEAIDIQHFFIADI